MTPARIPTALAAAGDAVGDDSELMREVQRGDEAALGALMARWERPVKSVIGRLIMNASEAEELAHETFVRVWQQRARFRPTAEFRPWVFSIALNLARNRLRWWRRRPIVALQDWEGDADTAGDPARANAPTSGAGALERKERAAAVREAIAALPSALREVIVLCEYERLSHAEIATAVGATPKAVETRLYRAREKLRHALRGWV